MNDAPYAYLAPLPDPVIVVGPGLGVLFANMAARTAFPALDALQAGDPLSRFVRQPVALAAAEQALAHPDDGPTAPVTIAVHGKVERRLQVRAVPSPAGAAMLLFHDITASWRSEQMRADFIANASHELRTPIASLIGYIETLQGPAKDDAKARAQFLDIMSHQAARMSRLISDLMSLSRIELDEHMPPTGITQIGTVLNKAADVLAPLVAAENITLDMQLDPDIAASHIQGDEDELVQIFVNLIDNAVKYGGDGGRVRISAAPSSKAGFVSLAVTDFGAGIGEEHLPRLTERFYRVDVRTSRQRGGTGLGLAIVKHIVNRHDGALNIRSTQGKGSTFEVLLPCKDAQATKATPQPTSADDLSVDVFVPII